MEDGCGCGLATAQKFFERTASVLEISDRRRRGEDVTARRDGVASVSAEERDGWREAATLFWHITRGNKLQQLSDVSSDARYSLFKVSEGLLNYILEQSTGGLGGNNSLVMLLERVVSLGNDHVLYFLRAFCTPSKCAAIMNGDSDAGYDIYLHVQEMLIRQQHFRWMTAAFQGFCAVAHRAHSEQTEVDSTTVSTMREVLGILHECCTTSSQCARALMYTEPRPLVVNLVHGFRLRIAHGSLIRPRTCDRRPPQEGSDAASLLDPLLPIPASSTSSLVACGCEALEQLSGRELAEYLTLGRNNVYDEINGKALEVALSVVEVAGGYESPTVVTALCLTIELSSSALIPELKNGSQRCPSLEMQIAMYENVIAAWGGLCRLLHSTKECGSLASLSARRDALLQRQMKHNLAGSLRQLLQCCSTLLCAEPSLFTIVKLQCTPSVACRTLGEITTAAAEVGCEENRVELASSTLDNIAACPLKRGDAEGFGEGTQLELEMDNAWWYNNKSFISIVGGITSVLSDALEGAQNTLSLLQHIVDSLTHVAFRDKSAFAAVDGHSVVQRFLSLLLNYGRPSASGDKFAKDDERLGVVTLLHQVIVALLHLYGNLQIEPRSCEVADIIELPLLLLKWFASSTSDEEKKASKSSVSLTTTLWYTTLLRNADEGNTRRAQEVLMEFLRSVLEDGELLNVELPSIEERGARANGEDETGTGKRDVTRNEKEEEVEEGIVSHLRDVLALLLQRNPRFLSPRQLEMLFNLASAKGEVLAKLGSVCLCCCLSHGEVYYTLQELILVASPATLLELLPFLSTQLTSGRFPAGTKYERQVWLFKSGCVDAVVAVLGRVMKVPNQMKQFAPLIQQLFHLLSVSEPVYGLGTHLSNTTLSEAFTSSLASIKNVEHIVLVLQAVFDAAISNYGSLRDASCAVKRYGCLTLPYPNCCIKKIPFVELLPPLLRHLHVHALQLESDAVSALRDVLRATAMVRCDAMLDWALEMKQAALVPYLELDAALAEQRLPLVDSGDAEGFKSFWTPILLDAPERSEMRFSWTGGVTLNVGEWPRRGFSIASCFRFEEFYARSNLFQFVGIDGTLRSPVYIFLSGSDAVYIEFGGKTARLSEAGMLKDLIPRKWLHFHVVMSVAHTLSVYLNATKIGTCSLPCLHPGSQALIHIGFVNTVVPNALFSIGTISVWQEELTTPQVEADLAGRSCEGDMCVLLPCEVPMEISGSRGVSPIEDCVALFSPCEVDEGQALLNTLHRGEQEVSMITAKITGGCVLQPPRSWIDYRGFFLNRGGLMYLLRWIRESRNSTELEQHVALFCVTIRCTASASTADFRTYVLLHYYLRHVASLITPAVCDSLVHLATTEVVAGDGLHPFIMNRLIFDHVVRDVELLASMPLESALHMTERVGKMFDVFSCRFASHNVRFIRPFCFVDSVLNSLVYGRVSLPFAVLIRLISNLKHVIIACDFEPNLVNCFVTSAALLTPAETRVQGKESQCSKLPAGRFTQIHISQKTAYNICFAILRSLIECGRVNGPLLCVISRLIDFDWFAVCVSRFADPTCVVYATQLFLGALKLNRELREEVAQHPASVAAALEPHSFSEDLLLLLLGHSVGADTLLDLLNTNKSLYAQLKSALGSGTHELDPVITPVFARLLMSHLRVLLTRPLCFRPVPIMHVMDRRYHRSCRLFKYFHFAVVCSRIMLKIYVQRLTCRTGAATTGNYSQPGGNPATGSHTNNCGPLFAMENDAGRTEQTQTLVSTVAKGRLWRRPSLTVLGLVVHLFLRAQRSRYAQMLNRATFSLLTDWENSPKEDLCGTAFMLDALHQISLQPDGFFLMTRSPYQVAALALFGSLVPKDELMSKSAELARVTRDFSTREVANLNDPSETSTSQKNVNLERDEEKESISEEGVFCFFDRKTSFDVDIDDHCCNEEVDEESVDGGEDTAPYGGCLRSLSSLEGGIRKKFPTLPNVLLRADGEADNAPFSRLASPSPPLTSITDSSDSFNANSDGPQSGNVVPRQEEGSSGRPIVATDLFDSVRTLNVKNTRLGSLVRCIDDLEATFRGELKREDEDVLLAQTIGDFAQSRAFGLHSLASLTERAVSILGSTIVSSLQTIPVPSEAHPYGPSGHLLFRLMLITGTLTNEEEGALLLTNFFIHQILKCVAAQSNPKASAASQQTHETGMRVKSSLPVLASSESLAGNDLNVDDRATLTPLGGDSCEGISFNGGALNAFISNVCAFNDFLVDLLSFHVIELSTIAPYFVHLLMHATESWHPTYLLEVRLKLLKVCIVALNRQPAADMTVEHLRLVHVMLSYVLESPCPMKPLVVCLIGSLLRIYNDPSFRDAVDPSSGKRKELITLCLWRIAQTYQGNKELKKAVTVSSLASRISIYDGFASALLQQKETDAIAAFSDYMSNNATKVKAVISGRLKVKVALAVKHLLKRRSFYIEQIKLFDESYHAATRLMSKHSEKELIQAYNARFSSRIGPIPPMRPEQFHWLAVPRSSLGNGASHLREAFCIDAGRNRSTILTGSKFFENVNIGSDSAQGTLGDDMVTIRNTSSCEQQVNHISALLPPVPIRCRPYSSCASVPFIDGRCKVTPSAIALLQHLLEPGEVLRYVSNGFRVNGIHVAPCLILLTDDSLKVFCFSHITEKGDVFLYDYQGTNDNIPSGDCDDGSDQVNITPCDNVEEELKSRKQRSQNTTRSFAVSVTNKFQRFLTEGSGKGRGRRRMHQDHADGTKVAQSVRQTTGHPCKSLYWCYPVRNIYNVRMGIYMHQDTAVLLDIMYSDGLMLSLVDPRQSMNTRARDDFLEVLEEVIGTRRCTVHDHGKRSASMLTMLSGWGSRSVSTFEYLSFLNRMAGRTFADYNQYPIFPWVIADYKSAVLDLNSDVTYRDLSRPMGAQTSERRRSVEVLYQQMTEVVEQTCNESVPAMELTQPFHHGTHYSTSGGVLYYLIRMEPFTTFARIFQGGEFDVASRLFDTIDGSFQSCLNGPADCKELTPEFFLDGSFLINMNNCNFGAKTDGTIVGDVKLPPWAKNSTQVFTAVMRYVLEGDRVAQSIHRWIDLIFGVCRRGKLAVECHNVFQRMTYGEEVVKALKESRTPHDIDVIVAEVDNFGQTPVQLFQERHPTQNELRSLGNVAGEGSAGSGFSSNLLTAVSTSSTVKKGDCRNRGNNNSVCGDSSFVCNASVTSAGSSAPRAATPKLFGARDLSPKVHLMMECAAVGRHSRFTLNDITTGGVVSVPASVARLCKTQLGAVVGFAATRSGEVACCFKHIIPVDDENHLLCFSDGGEVLMRIDLRSGELLSSVRYATALESSVSISCACVGCRETLVVVGCMTGTLHCLRPSVRGGVLRLSSTLCHHTHAVAGLVISTTYGRMISFTVSASDAPIVWCIQMERVVLLHRLEVASALSSIGVDQGDALVAAAVVDPLSSNAIIVTRWHLLIFDPNGDLYGLGHLSGVEKREAQMLGAETICEATPSSVEYRRVPITAVTPYTTLEWAYGTQLLLTGHEDGSISLWLAVRLPPDEVTHGNVVSVRHHGVVVEGSNCTGLGAVTAIQQQQWGEPAFLIGYSSGAVKTLSFTTPHGGRG